jgi:hypothetical protein
MHNIAKQDFAGLRAIQFEHLDFEWFACFPGDCSTRLHCYPPPLCSVVVSEDDIRMIARPWTM